MNTKALENNNEVPAINDLATLVAADVMTESVITVGADWSVSQLAEFFLENGISGAPVVSSDKALIGVVSHTDIVRHSTQSLDEPDQTHDYYLGVLKSQVSSEDMLGMHLDASDDTKVTDIMTPIVFQVDARAPIVEIAEMMTRGRIHRVFVIREDEVLGVISALDLIKVLCVPMV